MGKKERGKQTRAGGLSKKPLDNILELGRKPLGRPPTNSRGERGFSKKGGGTNIIFPYCDRNAGSHRNQGLFQGGVKREKMGLGGSRRGGMKRSSCMWSAAEAGDREKFSKN